MAKTNKGQLAPLSAAQLSQLRADANDLWAAAARKGITLDQWEHSDESAAARDHFALGTWLLYFSTRIGKPDGLQDRIDCARRLFGAGICHPGYRFFTVFGRSRGKPCRFSLVMSLSAFRRPSTLYCRHGGSQKTYVRLPMLSALAK